MSTLSIATVQFDIKWLNMTDNLACLDAMLLAADIKNQQLDLVLLPETFSTGFCISQQGIEEVESSSVALAWMKQQAAQLNVIMAGSVLIKSGDKKANRFYWVRPNGDVEFYDKRHLFRLGNEQDYVQQGMQRKIIDVKGIKILPIVCYDLRFPVWSRNQQDYDVLINVANWPSVRRYIWDNLLQARAIENQAYVVGVNRVGDDGNGVAHCGGTQVFDYSGLKIAQAADNTAQITFTELDIAKLTQFKQQFPMHLDADEFSLNI